MANEKTVNLDAARSIRVLMEIHNLSEFRFSEVTGLSQPSVSNWLLYKSVPGTKSIMKICDAFGITIGEFEMLGLSPRKDEEKEVLYSLWRRLPDIEQSVLMKCLRLLSEDR